MRTADRWRGRVEELGEKLCRPGPTFVVVGTGIEAILSTSWRWLFQPDRPIHGFPGMDDTIVSSSNPEVLDYLREQFARVHIKIDKMGEDIRELKRRDTLHDMSFSSMRREIAIVGEAVAHLAVRFDQVEDRLDRIERRLDIVSA